MILKKKLKREKRNKVSSFNCSTKHIISNTITVAHRTIKYISQASCNKCSIQFIISNHNKVTSCQGLFLWEIISKKFSNFKHFLSYSLLGQHIKEPTLFSQHFQVLKMSYSQLIDFGYSIRFNNKNEIKFLKS